MTVQALALAIIYLLVVGQVTEIFRSLDRLPRHPLQVAHMPRDHVRREVAVAREECAELASPFRRLACCAHLHGLPV